LDNSAVPEYIKDRLQMFMDKRYAVSGETLDQFKKAVTPILHDRTVSVELRRFYSHLNTGTIKRAIQVLLELAGFDDPLYNLHTYYGRTLQTKCDGREFSARLEASVFLCHDGKEQAILFTDEVNIHAIF
jgi:hypothetical protein